MQPQDLLVRNHNFDAAKAGLLHLGDGGEDLLDVGGTGGLGHRRE